MLNKLRKIVNTTDKRYDELYHSYSKIKLDLKTLEDRKNKEIKEYKEKLRTTVAKNLIVLYDCVENVLNNTYKIKDPNKEVQDVMLDINTLNKKLKDVMKRFEVFEFDVKSKTFEKESMEVLSYVKNESIAKGTVLKTVKKGILFEGQVIKKPKVIVVE